MIGNERLLRKMSIGDILDYSIELYKRNFKKLFMLSLILYIPFILVYTGVISYLTGDLFKAAGIDIASDSISDTSGAMYKFLAYFVVIGLMGLLYVAFSLTLQPVLDASITQIIYNDAVNGKNIEWKDAVKKSFKNFGRLFLNRLLYGLILYGIIFAAVIAFYIVLIGVMLFTATAITATAVTAGASNTVFGGVLAGIAAVLLSILVFWGFAIFIGYFAMRFGLGTQSVIIENTTASRSISRSHELTAKKFWHAGLTVGIALLMTALLPTLLASGAYFLVFVDKGLYTLANTALQVIAAIVQPFLTVVMTMVFIDLKVRKEGLDLEVKVDTMLEEEKKRAELLQGGDTVNA